jgi:hypothetical protein
MTFILGLLKPFALKMLAWGAIAVSVLGALFYIKRMIETGAKAEERLATTTRNLEVSRDQLKAAADRPRATAPSEPQHACPPVVQYSQGFMDRAAEELWLLGEGSVVVEMMKDYAVMRDQARACQ